MCLCCILGGDEDEFFLLLLWLSSLLSEQKKDFQSVTHDWVLLRWFILLLMQGVWIFIFITFIINNFTILSLSAGQRCRWAARCAKARRGWRSRWSSARPGCTPTSASRRGQSSCPCPPSTTPCSSKVSATLTPCFWLPLPSFLATVVQMMQFGSCHVLAGRFEYEHVWMMVHFSVRLLLP